MENHQERDFCGYINCSCLQKTDLQVMFYTYTRLFQSGVCPILDYCSEIWGYKKLPQIDAIQKELLPSITVGKELSRLTMSNYL